MDRPRIAAVVSGAAASAAAFSVASHWRLIGTVTGAVTIAVIYALVSHWSTAGLDGAGKWVRRRASRRSSGEEGPAHEEGSAALEEPLASDTSLPATEATPDPVNGLRGHGGGSRRAASQWLLVGSACAALAVSVYTLATVLPAEPVDKVVVERVVVEKTVTVTTESNEPVLLARASAPAEEAGAGQAGDEQTSETQTGGGQVADAQTGEDASSGDQTAGDQAGTDGTDSATSEADQPQDGISGDDDSTTVPISPAEDDATVPTTVTAEVSIQPGTGALPPSTPPPTPAQ